MKPGIRDQAGRSRRAFSSSACSGAKELVTAIQGMPLAAKVSWTAWTVAGLHQVQIRSTNGSKPRVHSTLYMSRLLPIFEIYQDEREALDRFN